MKPTTLSLLNGGPAPTPDVPTLGAALVRAARSGNPQGLVFIQADGTEHTRTYGELLDEAAAVLAAIRAAGTRVGETVILQIADDAELLAAFWGCVLGGFVPMPVGAGSSPAAREAAPELLHCVWSRYGKPRVITGADQRIAPQAQRDLRWHEAWLGSSRSLLTHAADRAWHHADTDDLAALLLTSGSTGVPKAVRLTHRNILSRSAATAQDNGLSSTTRTFNWMPLDHVGGLLLFHTRDVYLGAHQVHARTEWVLADPLRWLAAVDRHRACTTWAPNFAFHLINDQTERLGEQPWDLSCLRYIMNGGEAVRGGMVRRFLALLAPFGLEQDAMYPGWGMSETSAGVVDCQFSTLTTGDERYVPVGEPQPGTALRCVDDQGRLVPAGTVGHLQVTGAAITSGYHDNLVQNRRSFTDDGWFRTGDLAFVKDGLLTVTGRADDVIECGEVTCHSYEIESAVEELSFITPTYTVAGPVTVAGRDELAVFFHPRGPKDIQETERLIRAQVADRLGLEVSHIVPLGKEDIPKTGIGKLRRAHLRERFESGSAARTGAPRSAA